MIKRQTIIMTPESRGCTIDHDHAHRVLFERGVLHERPSPNARWLAERGIGSITVRTGRRVVERREFRLRDVAHE
ncbi:hypothetical protein [Deinococcus peraridilitoris]|uniref:Uncharacterized protein n=1 Tax=Deinococcus peraridilitoris (strain DSM 19664 / LMG 22246 / CIP 109416 / KR-200) TaxID=937777 RepID=L0A1G3_DEIPD|nr:hypothetical protein [Deinococcus peraridilitoris]AFZ67017.1 hypothetical protein Deipe_1476 [Deinococcus peraridilitoris DSM 19664]